MNKTPILLQRQQVTFFEFLMQYVVQTSHSGVQKLRIYLKLKVYYRITWEKPVKYLFLIRTERETLKLLKKQTIAYPIQVCFLLNPVQQRSPVQ